ncbi:MAG: hypothetical protein JNK85_11670 [Verrucomicrobiales bacterium]|nr:hypothetical protein [Verrucomicrobiales bacterium]
MSITLNPTPLPRIAGGILLFLILAVAAAPTTSVESASWIAATPFLRTDATNLVHQVQEDPTP